MYYSHLLMWGYQLSIVKLSGAKSLRRTDPPSPRSQQKSSRGSLPVPCWNVDWLILCRQPHLLWTHECGHPILSTSHHFSPVLPRLCILQSFHFLFHNSPWALRDMIWLSHLNWALHRHCSLWLDQFWVSTLTTTHYIKKCLWQALIFALIYGYRNIDLESSLII